MAVLPILHTTNPLLNCLAVMQSGGIEAQERDAQKLLCQEPYVLPRTCRDGRDAREIYESHGIVVKCVTEHNPKFYDVELPVGWSIRPMDHDMWSYVADENLAERVVIFFKGSFHDFKAFASQAK